MAMISMPPAERRAYFYKLFPYLKTSLIFFGIGVLIGLMTVSRFPALVEHFEDSVANFIKTFRGMPKIQLAGAIFLNNASKTLLAILLGGFFGVIPGIFLLTNGVALGVVLSLSMQTRGLALSLLSILPHGVLELPAVFLGTSIGLMIGNLATRKFFRKADLNLGAELASGLRFFLSVIVPLLLVAALVEAFVTSALVSPS
jgi:stage II sporulation protein M